MNNLSKNKIQHDLTTRLLNLQIWSNKTIQILSLFITLAVLSSCNGGQTDLDKQVEEYKIGLENRIKELSKEHKSKRDSFLLLINKNPVYISITTNKKLSQDNLEFFEELGYSFLSLDQNGFSINGNFREKSTPTQLDMVKHLCVLQLRGGIPPQFYKAYFEYLNIYGHQGEKGKTFYLNDTSFIIEKKYNITSLGVILNPKNEKALDEFYLAQDYKWNYNFDLETNFNPQYINWKSFNEYLKKVYPNSPYYKSYDTFISANSLYEQYEEHEIKADALYKGKRLALYGVIEDLGLDILDNPYITLKTSNLLFNVTCYFEKKESIIELSKNQEINIIGECDGKLGNVMIKNSEVW